jgi:hypothetical protein
MPKLNISGFRNNKIAQGRCWTILVILWVLALGLPTVVRAKEISKDTFINAIETLASLGDRSTGTPGNIAAAEFIKKQLNQFGYDRVGSFGFSVPVRQHKESTVFIPDRQLSFSIFPLRANAISPGTISPRSIAGPLIYVGSGRLHEFNGKTIMGAVVLMELSSGKNWLNAANLGAKALIYVDRGPTQKEFFEDKFELTPVNFPRFWLPYSTAKRMFGKFDATSDGVIESRVTLISNIKWQEAITENIYCLMPGVDKKLRNELIIIEAFYDSTALVFGKSPGADEACSVATLLALARELKKKPPARSVLLVASSGHAQTLSGIREMIWSLSARSKDIRRSKKSLKATIKKTQKILEVLESESFNGISNSNLNGRLKKALEDQIKTKIDKISRHLMQLRMQQQHDDQQRMIQKLADQRLLLKRLGSRKTFDNLVALETQALKQLLPLAVQEKRAILADAEKQLMQIRSAGKFRSLVKRMDLSAVISLHLSSHGQGFGAFNRGWLYPLKSTINRVGAYRTLDEVMQQAASFVKRPFDGISLFQDTLRPSRKRSWQSYFLDRPFLGGEVSSLAGLLGVSLVTVDDGRAMWGTPYDSIQRVDSLYASKQSRFVINIIQYLAQAPALHEGDMPRDGFSTIIGRAKFLRHGELFPDQPAPGSIIIAYQGPVFFYTNVDTLGNFKIKGLADKKHVLHKVIIEGYRFDPDTGSVVLAIDKKQTGKPAYRVKMERQLMETNLVMFACKQSTVFNLLEPRNFRYMTKIQLLDARREASPLHYWWSRIDTRSSVIASFFLEPGSRYKLTLSDTVLRKKLILLNADEKHPEGTGYLVDNWPLLHYSNFKIARDMWALIEPRVANLEAHGIYNEKIRELLQEGTAALKQAAGSLDAKTYDQFAEAAARSWALASRVYDQVEKTQKDVLFGVLFYIALFVPFAFCMERFIFSYANIHKRIVAFLSILILLIALIYYVHPAFELAYSPTVVILAFFIMGLSFIVTLIIFFRFEEEMILLQQRATHTKQIEISRWKAFAAAFFLGVSNLRRRRLRTVLTCITLIILTFTIMSFTSVKSIRHHARLKYSSKAPYQGFLLKNINWADLPPEALNILSLTFGGKGAMAPRVWMEEEDRTRSTLIPIRYDDHMYEIRGLVGLSATETNITGLDKILISGRWFQEKEKYSVLLPERAATHLGIEPGLPTTVFVKLWGIPFEVIGVFSGKKLQEQSDLDGEPLTPVTFSTETSIEMTEVEMDAFESGEDVKAFQGRYQHVPGDLTVIIPHQTLLAFGGHLKGISFRPDMKMANQTAAQHLVERYGLSLFSGEPDGTFLYNASDTISYSGVPNIIIPLFIAIFIVLNTMISSVYERKREIGIYTSVGLAPSHVSFLFIAEAMAFAIISVVLGYLLAQTTASLFAGSSLWEGITVNYSSLAGVGAMLLVIFVVLVSVIYPSKVAARIAIPDVHRSWKLPEAKGNTLALTLPFLMKHKEHQSIGGYLFNYFEGHMDISHGLFSTGDLDFNFVCPQCRQTTTTVSDDDHGCCSTSCLNLNMNVWLAPFDFGIMQRVEILFSPSRDNSGFLEINVTINRKTGEVNSWRRLNKTFLHDLRKQLLMWRSLEESTKSDFAKPMTFAQKKSDQ